MALSPRPDPFPVLHHVNQASLGGVGKRKAPERLDVLLYQIVVRWVKRSKVINAGAGGVRNISFPSNPTSSPTLNDNRKPYASAPNSTSTSFSPRDKKVFERAIPEANIDGKFYTPLFILHDDRVLLPQTQKLYVDNDARTL
jgi:hypothetical protein